MSDKISQLRALRQKEILLPASGIKLLIRKITPVDFLERGNIPDVLEKLGTGKAQEISLSDMDSDTMRYIFSLLCVATISVEGDSALTMEKPPIKDPKVLSLYEIPQGDLTVLITEVFSFGDFGGDTSQKLERFQQE